MKKVNLSFLQNFQAKFYIAFYKAELDVFHQDELPHLLQTINQNMRLEILLFCGLCLQNHFFERRLLFVLDMPVLKSQLILVVFLWYFLLIVLDNLLNIYFCIFQFSKFIII